MIIINEENGFVKTETDEKENSRPSAGRTGEKARGSFPGKSARVIPGSVDRRSGFGYALADSTGRKKYR